MIRFRSSLEVFEILSEMRIHRGISVNPSRLVYETDYPPTNTQYHLHARTPLVHYMYCLRLSLC
jgi:hypothetical protein